MPQAFSSDAWTVPAFDCLTGSMGDSTVGAAALRSSTRRDVLAIIAMLGSGWAVDGSTASAQPASERPKEGDLLVSAESETVPAPTDIPLGGPPVLAWPMEATTKTVRKDSRLNNVRLDS